MTVYSIFTYVGIAALLLTILRWFLAKPSNIFVCYLQNFVGSLFIFSGFVKAVDPLGTSYKMHEYFEAFAGEGLRPLWEYLATWSTFMAITMIALELFVGFMLLIGWKPRFTVGVIWWLTLFFTFLTAYTYLSGFGVGVTFWVMSAIVFVAWVAVAIVSEGNRMRVFIASAVLTVLLVGRFFSVAQPFAETGMKVTDCGCFGDFIKLKPWETFWKDVVLDVMILVLVLGVKHIRPLLENSNRTVMAGVTSAASLGLCLYTVYLNEPIIDFRPYKVGNNINEQRTEIKPPVIEMMFLYKNKATGEVKEYTQKEFGSMNFEELEYVDRKDKVLDPGIPAKITNLYISNEEGVDITDTLLQNPNYSLMVVSWKLGTTNTNAYKQLNELNSAAEKAGIKFFAVTANDGHVDEFRHRHQTAYPFYSADETPLKTMIRSNPGLLLLKNGVVVNKWHYLHLPTTEELQKSYFEKK